MNAPAAKPSPLGELIARLSALHPKRIDLDLERMQRLLERLDHPERKLPPVIHVAGTNGKGSTIAYLRAILEAAGLRVHVYTSPYLVRINECFRLGRVGGGVLVGDDELRAALEHCERANAGAPITIFEIETAAAFWLFAQHPADVVLLEVGLGGRLDATNVIDAPLATVIAPVSMDHTEFLGETLTAIAGEKAAIIKRDVPAICAEQSPEAMAVIEAQARRLRAPLHAAGQHWHVNVERGRLVYQDDRGLMDLAAPKLFGRHQFDNAGLAIATLRAQDVFRIGTAAFEAGIVNAEWPARMQRLASGALVDQAPPGCEIWLDGGHNAEGGVRFQLRRPTTLSTTSAASITISPYRQSDCSCSAARTSAAALAVIAPDPGVAGGNALRNAAADIRPSSDSRVSTLIAIRRVPDGPGAATSIAPGASPVVPGQSPTW